MTDQVLPSPEPVGSNEAIRARLTAISGDVWRAVATDFDEDGPTRWEIAAYRDENRAVVLEYVGIAYRDENVAFIEKAPSDVKRLLAQVDALTLALKQSQDDLHQSLADRCREEDEYTALQAELSSARDALLASEKRIKELETALDGWDNIGRFERSLDSGDPELNGLSWDEMAARGGYIPTRGFKHGDPEPEHCTVHPRQGGAVCATCCYYREWYIVHHAGGWSLGDTDFTAATPAPAPLNDSPNAEKSRG